VELYLYSPNTLSWRGAQLKHRGNFTFTFAILLHFLQLLLSFSKTLDLRGFFESWGISGFNSVRHEDDKNRTCNSLFCSKLWKHLTP